MPPPLPPRDPDHDQDQHPDHDTVPPPSYDEAVAGAGPASPSDSTAAAIAAASLLDEKRSLPAASYPSSHLAPDPRSSSSQSLVSHPGGDHEEGDIIDNHGALGDTKGRPSTSAGRSQRRTLLLVYIHGFYGNAQSFQSFPYHVHSYLRTALAASHSIHTKIYPRYKTYRAIEIARDNFSQWLEPHEGPDTDVILVGHSMGGILAADVVLMVGSGMHHVHCIALTDTPSPMSRPPAHIRSSTEFSVPYP